MQKLLLIFGLLFFFNFEINSQNLIDNWSFEDTIACPTNLAQISNSAGWFQIRNTPDYYNICSQDTTSVPSNIVDYQWPRSGNAYSGLMVFSLAGTGREFMSTSLNAGMQIGTKYYVKLFVSSAVNQNLLTGIAVNRIGVQFSTIAYSASNPAAVNNLAHVFASNVITDTLGWSDISGSFIADSNYTFIGIGNFFDNPNTSFIPIDTNSNVGYYFIDDVCISTDSMFCELLTSTNTHLFNSNFQIYPNPVSESLNVKGVGIFSLKLYDLTGRVVLVQNNIKESTHINMSEIANGIYCAEIISGKSTLSKKIVISH